MDTEMVLVWKRLYATPGVFRNANYTATERRSLGWMGAIVQYSASHLSTKRPPSTPPDLRVVRQVDASHFNFSKVHLLPVRHI